MGAYLSEPITEKVSTDEAGERVICGASSMQGWRNSQEDAHNCSLDYDTDTSFFAVYDGHGGHEVAVYTSQHLPEYLKNTNAYKKGDYTQALKDAFLQFDATLITPEVVAVLKQIASSNSGSDEEEDEEEENVKNLYEEAEMPLEQVMAKYQNDLLNNAKKLKQEDSKPPVSPFLRGKRSCTAGASSSGAGSSATKEPGNGNAESDEEHEKKVSSSSSQAQSISKQLHSSNETSDSSASNGDSKPNEFVETANCKETVADSSGDAQINSSSKTEDKSEVNGETGNEESKTGTDSEGVTSSSMPQENGEVVEGEGKGKTKVRVEGNRSIRKLRQRCATAMYRTLLGNQDNSDSDSDDDGDESFQGAENSSDEDGEEEEDEADGNEDEEDDNDEDDDEDDDSMVDDEEDEDDFAMKMTEKPGLDSGCTAVVALLKGQELYVANAGDSRCVVCRKGEAIEMSLDHKPEDELERTRIMKAGGFVGFEGRVNGGLNLSRALGDHAYKQSEGLSAEEQMITALPDVRTLMIDPKEDEFMILACDGIWNFMSSQEVVDFIRPRIQKETKLSKICEELFDHCLAPHTLGDGTGCDNMTAVLVQFRPELANKSESKSLKRAASPACETAKRPKTEESEAESV